MTNPNNAIGTNAAYGGRTSVNAANDDLATYTSAGLLSGFALSPDTGMVLNLGGVSGTRDVAVAEDAGGNRTTINNISGSPISVTIPAAPASQSRIDAVVAYVANPPQGEATTVDNPAACGLIVVSGTASSSPSVPNDSAIRTAITADGAAGSTAYYAVLGTVTVASGTTNITSNMISAGVQATPALAAGSVTSDKVDFTTLSYTDLYNGSSNTNVTLSSSVSNYDYIEIYYKWKGANNEEFYTKIEASAGKFGLSAGGFENNQTMYYEYVMFSFSGTTITRGNGLRWNNTWGQSGITSTQINSDIYITRVVGVKLT